MVASASAAYRWNMPEEVPSALSSLEAIQERIGRNHCVLFLDYDGTLTPIVEHPDEARLTEEMRDRIQRLASCHPIAIVSGRDRGEVERLVGVPGLIYAGSHGFDIAGPGLRREVGRGFLVDLDRAERALREALADVDGALVDRKAFTVATHYRMVDAARREAVVEAVRDEQRRHPRLRLERGHAVVELKPSLAWDKGAAVLWIMDELRLSGAVPVYVGDDVTDESAFRALDPLGITVVVDTGDRPTVARYRLRDPGEVGRFLDALMDAGISRDT